jgi:sulfite reductase alpha subunit
MADDKKFKTPLLDELQKGPWPSFVKDFKHMAERKPMINDLLGQLELSYKEREGHWKHGGLVGVMGYGGGVIGRYSDAPDKFPNVAHFHTVRVNQPSGWFYTSQALRELCDIWDRHGSGMTNMHGSTGDCVFLGTTSEELEPIFAELIEKGWDLGGSGSDVRTPSCCNGMARCEWACYDTMDTCYNITQEYQDELHRPAFAYKWKFKFSGCPNDCVSSIARSDLSVIGTWRDDIRIDQKAVQEYADAGMEIRAHVTRKCPTACMRYDGKEMKIDNRQCNRCMHCINVMPKALRPGTDTGAMILIGAKAPIIEGALLASVLVPFMKMDKEDDYQEFKDLMERIWEFWDEHGVNRERIGECIERVGLGNFIESIGEAPIPEMVKHPRTNPYIFYEEYFEEVDDEGAAAK